MIPNLPPSSLTVTQNYLVQPLNQLILADTTSNSIVLILPDLLKVTQSLSFKASGNLGYASLFTYYIKKIAANNTVTIQSSIGSLIDGNSSVVLTGLNDGVILKFDGKGYYITSEVLNSTSNFITSVSNSSTINLGVTAGDLRADIISPSITINTGTGLSGGGVLSLGGTLNLINTLPDQTVSVSGSTGILVTGTYPNFVITNTSPSSGGTVTSISGSGDSTGLTLTGGPITTSGTLTLGGDLVVANGGTGNTTFTAYSLITAGTTSTGALQNVSGVGTSGQLLTSNGASTLPSWTTFTSSESSSTPVVDNSQTAGFNLKYYYFVTLPSTYAWYHITGIEWKNGTSVSGNVITGVDMVDANPPTLGSTMLVANAQLVAQAGTNAVQRVSNVASQEIPGGTVVGIWLTNTNGLGNFRILTGQPSQNTYKNEAVINPLNNDNVAWTVATNYIYLKIYYKGHN